uniref:Uncharacterized protein n=1 Tax=Anguilla anguilla TaxID=7936 RepID=A0A0E9VUC1_ANGAN
MFTALILSACLKTLHNQVIQKLKEQKV